MKRWHQVAACGVTAGIIGALSGYYRNQPPPRIEEPAPLRAAGPHVNSLEGLFEADNERNLRDRAAMEAAAASAAPVRSSKR